MESEIPPTPEALEEALCLSEEILKDIELNRTSLVSIALKASRLARLLNNNAAQQVFVYEASGYPITPTGIKPDVWKYIELAGRTYKDEDSKTKKEATFAYTESVEQLEQQITAAKIGLEAAADRDVSISSANPTQFVAAPMGNVMERNRLHNTISTASRRLASRRSLIYQFVTRCYYELKFSGIAQDVFSQVRETVDKYVGKYIPDSVQKFTAVHDNLRSENPEDWSNAVHSCRRILQDLADSVFKPQTEDRVSKKGGKEQVIHLGVENYINRLICFAEDNSKSERYNEVVGSHLGLLGDRLDSIFAATQKGSHSTVGRNEAHRYVVYTYMLVGDILSLIPDVPKSV